MTETFPRLVRDNARTRPERVAIREKDLGIWQSYRWTDYSGPNSGKGKRSKKKTGRTARAKKPTS